MRHGVRGPGPFVVFPRMIVAPCPPNPHAGLYKGLLPNIFKLAPAAGVSWYIFEETKRWMGLDPRV